MTLISAFFSLIDTFSNLCSFDVDNLLYFCTMSYVTFPNNLCDIKHYNYKKKDLKKLFEFATSGAHILFDGN